MSRSSESRRQIFLLIPVLLAAALSLGISLWSIGYRLAVRYPLQPWESAMIVDAYRITKHLPVYEKLGTGHAAHMYGPLSTYLLAAFFWFTGPNLWAGRVIAACSALVLCRLFIRAFSTRRSWAYSFIAASLVISLHYRCRAYFTETRPDALSLLLATLSLLAAYRAHQSKQIGMYLLAALLAVLAMLFKQTYAAAVLVPPIAAWVDRSERSFSKIVPAMIPGIAIFFTLIVLRFGFPLVWFYAFKVPSSYTISPDRAQQGLIGLLIFSPLFVALASTIGFSGKLDPSIRSRVLWLTVATVIGCIVSVASFAKHGGSYNSLLPGFAAMTGLTILLLPGVLDMLAQPQFSLLSRTLMSVMLGLVLCATTFGIPSSWQAAFDMTSNTDNYQYAIIQATNLPGLVICPEEPTVTLFATGRADRSLDAELDAYGRPEKLPKSVIAWIQSANYVIRVHSPYENLGPGETTMHGLGFDMIPANLARGYTLWQRRSDVKANQNIPIVEPEKEPASE